jgi:RecB family exonuclease
VYSYAKSHNEIEQLPTPYLSFDEYQLKQSKVSNSRELNVIEDSQAPCIEDYEIKEGVSTLQDQMDCAFKGFSKRLHLEKFDAPHIGFNRLEQGNLIHKVLETFYTEVKSKESLLELSSSELDDLLERHIDSAINNKSTSRFKKIEKIRIKKILHDYFELEKQRDVYEVIKTETTTEVSINNLSFKIRLDRVDRLPNGNKLIIDYKTGKAEISQMTGSHIKQAQLPIYALTNSVNGVAFAKINATKCEYLAITNDESALPVKKTTIPKWEDQLVEWESILNSASYDFQNGVATVLPEKNACEFCDYDLLCRVEKLPNHR